MKPFLFPVIWLSVWVIFSPAFAQKPAIRVFDQQEMEQTPWTSLDVNRGKENFQFAVVTDRTGGHRPGVFLDAVHKLNLLQPEFVMSVGDLIEGYTEDTLRLLREWDEFDGFVSELEMPFFYVPGNHDITNKVMDAVWKERLGPTWYSFVYQDVLFLCLNSEDQQQGAGRGTISEPQFNWIKRTLENNPDPRWTLVFLHQPLWNQAETSHWEAVEKLLANRPHTVFAGHEHRYVKENRNNGKYFTLATTGGGSPLRGARLGEFDHVVWVTMTDGGPIIANLQLAGIWGEDVVTPEIKSTIARAYDQHCIRILPLFEPDENAEKQAQETTVIMVNEEDYPMVVRYIEGFNWDYSGEVEQVEWVIPPNSREKVRLRISPRKPEATVRQPFQLKAQVYWDVPDQPHLELPFSWLIQQEPTYLSNPVAAAPIVDGNLEEWGVLPEEWLLHDGTATKASFGVRHDEEYLYLAVNVLDDQIDVSSGTAPWAQDYVGVIIDTKELVASSMDVGDNWYESSFYFLVTPAHLETESVVHPRKMPVEGMTYRCLANSYGFTLEMAVPLEKLHSSQGKDWKHFRLNLVAGDKDGDDFSEHWFKPAWRSSQNRVGTGIFFRQ